ncbi:hypothetical protein [Natronococcus jeotgali]|uniref:Group 1 glycosyl transferase n=1 Tax=Natronococcus jeotgali DSM 18795 TaxID=1227498 RepID=L9XKJ3_9EURY|nr:hypothetical protein [Natronococcus jeotgali]ELY62304.1 group 1 glycosyl transferase [Natronococcus jeotgali DSM 18795]
MKISHYLELEDHVTGGIRESVAHQREILDRLGSIALGRSEAFSLETVANQYRRLYEELI